MAITLRQPLPVTVMVTPETDNSGGLFMDIDETRIFFSVAHQEPDNLYKRMNISRCPYVPI
jgi:hypothetical protein